MYAIEIFCVVLISTLAANLHYKFERYQHKYATLRSCVAQCLELNTTKQKAPCLYNQENLQENKECQPLVIQENNDLRVVCYLYSLKYKVKFDSLESHDIDSTLCTHVILELPKSTLEGTVEEFTENVQKYTEMIAALHSKGVKVLTKAVTHGVDQCGTFNSMFDANASVTINVIDSFLEMFQLDGIDITLKMNTCCEKTCGRKYLYIQKKFDNFIKLLSEVLKKRDRVLTTRIQGLSDIIAQQYNLIELPKHVEWITIETYGYSGPWNNYTSHAIAIKNYLDVLNSITSDYPRTNWKKFHLTILLQGMVYNLVARNKTFLGAPAFGPAKKSRHTDQSDYPFFEICENKKYNGWNVKPSKDWMFYTYDNTTWVTYHDTPSLRTVMQFIRKRKLGGITIFFTHYDDQWNLCKCGYFPILRSINEELRGARCPIKSCT